MGKEKKKQKKGKAAVAEPLRLLYLPTNLNCTANGICCLNWL